MVDTARLVARVETDGVGRANRELDRLTQAAQNAEARTDRLRRSSEALGRGLTIAAGAGSAFAVSGAALAVAYADARIELNQMARDSGLLTSEFQAQAFAARPSRHSKRAAWRYLSRRKGASR